MKRLFAIAVFLMASTAAQAQYTFEYGGRIIRIDPDRGTVSIPGVYDNTGRRAKRPRSDQAKSDPQAPPAAPAQPAPAQASPESSTAAANVAPADKATSSPATAPTPQRQPSEAPAAAPSPPPALPPPVIATAPSAPTAPVATTANSPLGVWLTEEKESKVRIEQCGANLCGYSVDPKSNQNGDQVLINMKPAQDSKWSGRIFDPTTGSSYDSTITLKGANILRVQGCALGGMFCGGQTWSRLN